MSKRRGSYGLQSIDTKISGLLKPLFQSNKKKFVLINNLVKNWAEIVGKKYSKFCYPKLVNLGKDKSTGGKLTIAVYNPAVGFFLESNSEIITERIAAFYGFKSISKIIIKQEPKDIKSDQIEEIKLPQEQEKFVNRGTSNIADQELAKTLQRLGREILNDNKE